MRKTVEDVKAGRVERGGEMGARRGLGRGQERKRLSLSTLERPLRGKEPEKEWLSLICITESLDLATSETNFDLVNQLRPNTK